MSSPQSKPTYLFVYGTLLRGMGNPWQADLFQHAKYVGPGELQGQLFKIDYYPGAIPSSDQTDIVKGEIYLLPEPERILALLDEYEEYDKRKANQSEFIRKKLDIRLTENDAKLKAWVYLYNRPVKGKRQLKSGDFKRTRHHGNLRTTQESTQNRD